MKIFRNKRVIAINAAVFSVLMILDMAFATASLALTGGPSQPEVSSFTPVSTSDLVNLSSGDFNYNIPLLDVGGYPVNISYNSGVSMDEEASWVGLGWNLNPGVINRNMRALPDDFNGLGVKKQFNMQTDRTYGVEFGANTEIFGSNPDFGLGLGLSLGVKWNNYNGVGVNTSTSINASMALPHAENENATNALDLGLTIGSGTDSGFRVSPSIGLSSAQDLKNHTNNDPSLNLGLGFNSRSGYTGLSLSGSVGKQTKLNKSTTFAHKDDGNGHRSAGTTISFLPNTYSPVTQNSRENLSYSFNAKFGLDIFGVDPSGHVEAYYSQSKIAEKTKKVNSFGYLFAQNSTSDKDQHDFNREKDGTYNKFENRLPLTNQTYDIFSASGQGMSGMFRPYRNDIGVVHDPLVKSKGNDASGGVEIGASGPTVKVGSDITVNFSSSHTGEWMDKNDARGYLDFEKRRGTESNFEPSYFREVGELAVDDEMLIDNSDGTSNTFLEKIGGNKPVRVKLKNISGRALKTFVDNTGEEISFPSLASGKFRQEERKKRNKLFSYLSVAQAVSFATRPNNIKLKSEYVNENQRMQTSGRAISATNSADYQEQIGEITVTQNDGSRYIYGKPLYNITQKEVTFNASANDNIINTSKGTVTYDADDASLGNENGLDHYYSSTEMPPFAHSYMITEILSTDYSDSDNIPGPSEGDYGNYTLFNYCDVSDYMWRTPYTDANYNEGFRSVDTDDQGSYMYGKKDLAYLESIETKTHVAIFHKSARKDGLSAYDEHNDSGSRTEMLKIDKIELFTQAEYAMYLEDPTSASPIKTVHFTYDYFLGSGNDIASNVPNNNGEDDNGAIVNQGGKLTLKSVYFTYRNSHKAKFSKYEFVYGSINDGNNRNFTYDTKAYDVWGNYKPSGLSNTSETEPNTTEFPYVKQLEHDTEADVHDFAAAWHLSEIKLPSGGDIKIEFESDDYAYVQDKEAMQMFRVMGSAAVSNSSVFDMDLYSAGNNELFDSGLLLNELYEGNGDKDGYLWTCIASEMELNHEQWEKAISTLREEEGHLQFRYLVNVSKDGANDFEFVSGYGVIDKEGANGGSVTVNSGSSKYAWIKFKGVNKENKKNSDEGNDHPVSKAAWNFTRQYLPKKAYNQPELSANSNDDSEGGLTAFFKGLAQANILGPFKEALKGPNGFLKSENKSRIFQPGKSWVRLHCPKEYKFGGGSRVKTIVSNDNWSVMSGDDTATDNQFGQEYTYKTTDGKSSGVASFEPLMSKENPWVVPVKHTKSSRYVLPNMKEEPIGSSFFPSPSVTYSRVKVRDIIFDGTTKIETADGDVHSSRTGYSVNEFYTTKDFPTKVSLTSIDAVKQKSSPVGGLTKVNQRDLMAVSQGYQVEINDMDGKPKSTRIFGENQTTAISGVDYLYEENQVPEAVGGDMFEIPTPLDDIPNYALNNDVVAINSDGTISKTTVGVEVDMVSDFRESFNKTRSIKTKGNMSLIYALIVPVPVPTVFPNTHKSRTRFRSTVMTKVINRRGILRETVAFDNGAAVSTKNLAYDANTGQVLLTSTKNEFGDEIFNLNAPAYWAYEEMGQASQNIGYSTEIRTTPNGKIMGEPKEYLVYGDELAISDCVQKKGWVWHTQNGNDLDDNKYIIDAQGTPIEIQDLALVKVIKSGYKNAHAASMTSMTLMHNPLLDYNNTPLANGEKIGVFREDWNFGNPKIIDVSAIEYSDRWKGFESGKYVDQISCSSCEGCTNCDNCPDCPDCIDSGGSVIQGPFWTCDIEDANFTYEDIFTILMDYQSNGGCAEIPGFFSESGSETTYEAIDQEILNGLPSYPNASYFTIEPVESGYSCLDYTQTPNYNDVNYPVWDAWDFYPLSYKERISYNIIVKDIDLQIIDTFEKVLIGNYFLFSAYNFGALERPYESKHSQIDEESFNDGTGCFVSTIHDPDSWQADCGQYPEYTGLSNFFVTKIRWGGHSLLDDGSSGGDGSGGDGTTENTEPKDPINPFVQNYRGQFRPVSSYAYLGERDYTYGEPTLDPNRPSTDTDIKKDGVYSSFNPYWVSEDGAETWRNDMHEEDWTWTSSITNFNPYGPEVENLNALGQLSSALFGYHQTLPTAVAANASYNQIAFDNFEDYYYRGFSSKDDDHFSFNIDDKWDLDFHEYHTGKYSLRLQAVDGKREFRCIRNLNINPSENYCVNQLDSDGLELDPIPDPSDSGVPYYLRRCDELGVFGPQTYDAGAAALIHSSGGTDFSTVEHLDQKYVLSYWVREKYKQFDMNSSESQVLIDGVPINYETQSTSNVINGWKKYDCTFTIPAEASETIEVVFRNNRDGQSIYIDDVRIHPYNGSMKSYVYDPETLRLVAELDDNNFATFYEYDEEGRLLRIKKETERGVVTIQESKTSTYKTPTP